MKNISRVICHAFKDGKRRFISNSSSHDDALWLHGHKIAFWDKDHNGRILSFSMCGWGTPTTRERLNSLFQVLGYDMSVYQKNWSQIFRFKGQDLHIEDDAQVNFHIDLDAVTFGKSGSVERRLMVHK
jgi:hypothetical protein